MEQTRSNHLALGIRQAEPVPLGLLQIGCSARVQQELHDLEITSGRFQSHDGRHVEQGMASRLPRHGTTSRQGMR